MSCTCRCRCSWPAAPDRDGLCGDCWYSWCIADEAHAPVDRSYIGVYGITTVWSGWVMSRGYGHLLAESPAFLASSERAPRCPDVFCVATMVRRVGAWKCYHHAEPVVTVIEERFPRAPQGSVLATAGKEGPQ